VPQAEGVTVENKSRNEEKPGSETSQLIRSLSPLIISGAQHLPHQGANASNGTHDRKTGLANNNTTLGKVTPGYSAVVAADSAAIIVAGLNGDRIRERCSESGIGTQRR
jgi:hypothetical protein